MLASRAESQQTRLASKPWRPFSKVFKQSLKKVNIKSPPQVVKIKGIQPERKGGRPLGTTAMGRLPVDEISG